MGQMASLVNILMSVITGISADNMQEQGPKFLEVLSTLESKLEPVMCNSCGRPTAATAQKPS